VTSQRKIMRAFAAFISVGSLVIFGCPLGFAKSSDQVPWTLNSARYGAAVVSDGSALYVIGGANNAFVALGGIERVDLATGLATDTPAHIVPRRFHAAVLMGREIYVYGGEAEEGLITSVEAINLDTWKVQTVGRMPTPRRALSAVKTEDMVFTLGGSAPGDLENLPRSTVMEVHDVDQKKWLRAPPMPEAKEVPVVLLQHYLYTLGGYNGAGSAVKSCERYDLSAGKWETLSAAPFALSGYSAVGLGKVIICFGDYAQLGRVAVFRTDTGTWSLPDVAFTPRRHSCACVAGNTVYVIGGVGGSKASADRTLAIVERFSASELAAAIARGEVIK
jgi:hypothetical protein